MAQQRTIHLFDCVDGTCNPVDGLSRVFNDPWRNIHRSVLSQRLRKKRFIDSCATRQVEK